MARIRSVHPGLWTDEAYVSVSPHARLLAIGIWNECDDNGAFEWKPLTLKMRLLPADNVDVGSLLGELCDAGMVKPYEVAGRRLGLVRNFRKYQRPKKPNSIYPIPADLQGYLGGREGAEPGDDEGPVSSPPVPPCSPPVPPTGGEPLPHLFPTAGANAPQMEDGGGRREEKDEGRKEESTPALRAGGRSRAAASDDAFAEFYAAYPRKVGPDDALKAWKQAMAKGVIPADIISGLNRTRFGDDPTYIPHPATWLRGGRWKDAPQPHLRAVPTPARPVADKLGWLRDKMLGGLAEHDEPEFDGPTLEAKRG